MLVAVLVRVREQGLLAVCLLDVGVGTRGLDGLEAQDVVEGGRFTPPDAQDGGFLFGGTFSLLIPLVVFSRLGGSVAGGVGAGCCCARHGRETGLSIGMVIDMIIVCFVVVVVVVVVVVDWVVSVMNVVFIVGLNSRVDKFLGGGFVIVYLLRNYGTKQLEY